MPGSGEGLIAAIAAALLVCGAGSAAQAQTASQATRDRIARCGGGLSISNDVSLGIANRVAGGRTLTARQEETVQAAILTKASRDDLADIYLAYTQCISHQSAISSASTGLMSRAKLLRERLTADGIDAPTITRIGGFADREYARFSAYDFVGAREAHRQLVIELVNLGIRARGNAVAYSFAYSEGDETKAAAIYFDDLCRLYADDDLCKVERDRIQAAPNACRLLSDPFDVITCGLPPQRVADDLLYPEWPIPEP